MSKTLFEKIVAREIPATIVYEDDLVLAIRDINPQAPKHVLIFPKKSFRAWPRPRRKTSRCSAICCSKPPKLRETGVERGGYRLVINNGEDGGESVPHLHVHILGGRRMAWPPG